MYICDRCIECALTIIFLSDIELYDCGVFF